MFDPSQIGSSSMGNPPIMTTGLAQSPDMSNIITVMPNDPGHNNAPMEHIENGGCSGNWG